MLQTLAEKDTALAMQREEADVQIAMWEKKCLAAQATADDAQGKAVELERQMQDTKTEADQLRLSCAQQVDLCPWSDKFPQCYYCDAGRRVQQHEHLCGGYALAAVTSLQVTFSSRPYYSNNPHQQPFSTFSSLPHPTLMAVCWGFKALLL